MMNSQKFSSNSGSALIYILIAIALLAVLTSSLMESSSQQSQAQNSTNLISDISSQVSLISSAIQECVLTYPDQDSSLTAAAQKNAPYPINGADSYFPVTTPPADNTVKFIRCPGNPGGNIPATSQLHVKLFGSTSGKNLPPAPNLFTEWEYYNGTDGVFFFTSTNKTDAYITSALTKLDAKFSKCEADIIDATSGAAKNLSSDTTGTGGSIPVRTCPAGSKCFRYWVIQRSTSVAQDSGCPD